MHIKFNKNGLTKEVNVGFSWTTFFFGAFVPISRCMWKHVFIYFATFGLAGLYYVFSINKLYALQLVENGWVVADSDRQFARQAWGIGDAD